MDWPVYIRLATFPQAAADDIIGDRAQRKGLKAKIVHESLLPG